MIRTLRSHLTYANVVATLALLVALSGSAYAAARIGSRDVVNNSLKSIDLKDGAGVTGADVRDDTLSGADVDEATLSGADRCPTGMTRLGGVVCVDSQTRGEMTWYDAVSSCAEVALRLPTITELYLAYQNDLLRGAWFWSEAVTTSQEPPHWPIGALAVNGDTGEIAKLSTAGVVHVVCVTPLTDRY